MEYVFGSLISGIAGFGLISNSMVILVYSRKPKLRKFYFFIINQSLLHIIASLNFFGVAVKIFLRQPMTPASFSCTADGFLVGFSGIGAIVMLAVISVERAVAIGAPFTYRKCTVGWKVACAYAYSLFITGPPLIGWGRYHPTANGGWFCCFDIQSRDSHTRSYIFFIFSAGFCLPLLAIILSYSALFYSVFRRSEARSEVPIAEQRGIERHWKLAKILVIMIAAYLFSWLPFALLSLLIQFSPEFSHPGLVSLSGVLAKAFVLYNPVVFGIWDIKFRKEFRRLFCPRQPHSPNLNSRLVRGSVVPRRNQLRFDPSTSAQEMEPEHVEHFV